MPEPAQVLVVGYGNPSRGDDALGPLLLEALDLRLSASTRTSAGGIEYLTDFQLQIDHALDLVGRRLVLFVDAHVDCPPPYIFNPVKSEDSLSYTTHAMSPASILRVYRDIKGAEPPASFLLAIRGERFELGEALSDSARANLDAAVDFAARLCASPTAKYWTACCQTIASPATALPCEQPLGATDPEDNA